MAITWETKITVLDVKKGNVSVTLKLIDNTNPEKIKILNSYAVLDALIDTPERKQQVLDELKRQYEKQKQNEINEAAIVGVFESEINVVAQKWEIK